MTAAAVSGALVLASVGREVGADRAPAPPVAPGATAIGSALAPGHVRSVDCRGSTPTANASGCTVLQTRLAGRPLSAKRGGVIRRWAVRGARGEIALQVLRRRGDRYREVTRSQFENVGGEGVHSFATDLPIEPGDLAGLEVTPGASIGVREGARRTTTARWFDRLRTLYRRPTLGADSGLDVELLLRADYIAGARPRLPAAVTGRLAAAAPSGRVVGSEYVEVSGTELRRVAAVTLRDRVVVDLFAGTRRLARITVPEADPRGELLLLRVEFPGVDPGPELAWRNPDGRIVMHQYRLGARSLRLVY